MASVQPKVQPAGDDIFAALIADHHKHRALIAALLETSGASDERKALFEELTTEIKGHAAAEEQSLWSTVLRKPEITEEGRHAVAEHHEMDKLLNDLAATDMASSGWLNKFHTVAHEYLHHIAEEEEEIFPAVAKALDDDDRAWMASVFARRKPAEKGKAQVTPEPKEDARH